MSEPLTIKVTQGDPTEVRVLHEGQWYLIRMAVHVMHVTLAEGKSPNDLPAFTVNAAPIMVVTKEDA